MLRRRTHPHVACVLVALTAACSGATDANRASVAAVDISPESVELRLGDARPLVATVTDAGGHVLRDRQVFWASEDPSVASVSPQGVVTALTVGRTQIAASAEGRAGVAAVTISPPSVASVGVAPASVGITVGSATQLQATTYDGAGNPLSGRVVLWSSNNPAIAAVDGSGVVSGTGVGQVTVTASSEGQSGAAVVTVAPAPVATIAVTPSSTTLPIGLSAQLSATLRDGNGSVLSGRAITWTSSSNSVAVSPSGVVTALRSGNATVSASAEGKSGSAAVIVPRVKGGGGDGP
jgi:uncharacterized protein YjdB